MDNIQEQIQVQKPKKYGKKFKTIRETLFDPEFKKYIFADDAVKFYYVHVNMDQVEIRQTPPDVFSMAYEGGLSMVGISVALDTYFQMLNSGQWSYYLPHFYWTFYSPDEYKSSQTVVFNTLSELVGLIAEDLYMAGYYISKAGGGLGVYIPMIAEQLEQISLAEVQTLEILSKVYQSKEFSFIETNLSDPTYGDLMFRNLSYIYDNTNQPDTTEQMGVNWNIMHPWRFESQMEQYIYKKYDDTVSDTTIYIECGITANNTINDTLLFNQNRREFLSSDYPSNISTDHTLDGVTFTWGISENRSVDNLILNYINKKSSNLEIDTTTRRWVLKGIDSIEQFFRAASQFIQQPIITNYLYATYLVDTSVETKLAKQVQPPLIYRVDIQQNFIKWARDTFSYGSALGSSLASWYGEERFNNTA